MTPLLPLVVENVKIRENSEKIRETPGVPQGYSLFLGPKKT